MTTDAEGPLRALDVLYSPTQQSLHLDLGRSVVLQFPVGHIRELADADDKDLMKVELVADGLRLACRAIGVELSVEGLITEILGEDTRQALRRVVNRD
jgi:hypothetical protein